MGIVNRIGTPLSKSATRVLRGCGETDHEVIIALQRTGCEVIGVERSADAPVMQMARPGDVVTMTDGAALRPPAAPAAKLTMNSVKPVMG